MPQETPLGRFISARWKALGIKQAELSRRTGMFPAHVQQIRVGKRKPLLRSHTKWARALELTTSADIERRLELMQLGHALGVTQEAYERLRARLDQQH